VSGSGSLTHYEIRIEGVLDESWTSWFEGLQVTSEGEQTIISGPLTDQPALHGVLAKVRDLGLCLISVRRLGQMKPERQRRKEARPLDNATAGHHGGNADPYLSVKGVRDIASGLIAVILLTAQMPHVLGWFELAASTIPIGDALIVRRHGGPKATAYGVHGATAVVLLATAALLFT
jgi:Domain of unknown function (DUF4267)